MIERIENSIYLIRGHRVMLDSELAVLYEIPTFYLNQQVRRNIKRFPEDFMFQLSAKEAEHLILQNAISKKGRGGRRFSPYVFTEQGVAMLSSVLNSPHGMLKKSRFAGLFRKTLKVTPRFLLNLWGNRLLCSSIFTFSAA